MDSQINKVHSTTIFCVVLRDLMGFWEASISPSDPKRRHINKLITVFHASVLLLIDYEFRHNIVKVAVDQRGNSRVNPQTTLTML